jgi:predicted aspartyl protease
MQAGLTRISWFAVLALYLAASVSHARDIPPDQVLKGQGLKRSSGSIWTLAGEAVILKDARGARGLSMQLRGAQEQQQALELGNQNPQVVIDNFRQQIEWLDQRIVGYDQELANLGPSVGNQAANVYHNMLVQERNVLVLEQRRLSSLIRDLADQRGQFQELKQQFNGEVARLRESYLEAVSALRKSVDEITAKYAELSGKEEVSKALQELAKSSRTKQKLGPSKDLEATIKWLTKLEGSVQTETVELHRDNGVDHVDVMLNSKGPVRMVFDTGAGPTTLSAELASKFGLKPTGRTITLVVADGTKVPAKEMMIRTVSLGRLTVRDVTCVVLGQSILGRFDFKYTQGSGRLVLTKVEPDEPAATSGKGAGSKKKRSGR